MLPLSAKEIKCRDEILRQGRLEGHPLTVTGTSQCQPAGVQQRASRMVTGGFLQPSRGAPAINPVACHWKSEMAQMHADLMRPSRVQLQFYKRGVGPSLQDAIAGAGLTPVADADGHALAMRRVARDRRVNATAQARHPPADHGFVNLLDFAPGELRREMNMGGVVLGRHQATAGIFVKTMHYALPRDPPNAPQFPGPLMRPAVAQSTLRVPR